MFKRTTLLLFTLFLAVNTFSKSFSSDSDPFYEYKGININAQHRSVDNYFLDLKTGKVYNADKFNELDPVTIKHDGAVHSKRNTPNVTSAEYNSVNPYIFMREIGGRVFLVGPAHDQNSLIQFSTSDYRKIIESAPAYGTPIVLFRTLDKGNKNEKNAYDIIKSGDKEKIATLFDDSFIKQIVLNANGNRTSDGLSNIPNGFVDAVKTGADQVSQRPWAQDIHTMHEGDHTTEIMLDPESVILVLYYDHRGVGNRKSNLKGYGFIDLYNYNQVGNPRSSSSMDINLYWKKN